MVRRYDDVSLKGIAADAREYQSKFPFEFVNQVSDGDVVADHREAGDGELKEYELGTVTSTTPRGATRTANAAFLGDVRSVYPEGWPGTKYRCTETGTLFVTGRSDPPRKCPVCGADGERDDVNTCTDAHASEDSQDDANDAQGDKSDVQDARDVQVDEQSQTTLNGFAGGD